MATARDLSDSDKRQERAVAAIILVIYRDKHGLSARWSVAPFMGTVAFLAKVRGGGSVVGILDGYTEVKPKAKGDAAYKAFGRFKTRLVDTYGVPIPKATSKAATKKAEERASKLADMLKHYEDTSTDQLHQLISQAYERQAKNPLGSDAILKVLKTVLKARTKDTEAESKAELKAKRDEVIKAVRECSDITRLDLVVEMLSQDNEVSFVTQ